MHLYSKKIPANFVGVQQKCIIVYVDGMKGGKGYLHIIMILYRCESFGGRCQTVKENKQRDTSCLLRLPFRCHCNREQLSLPFSSVTEPWQRGRDRERNTHCTIGTRIWWELLSGHQNFSLRQHIQLQEVDRSFEILSGQLADKRL